MVIKERILQSFAVPPMILGPRVATVCLCGLPFCIHDEQMRRDCRHLVTFDAGVGLDDG